MLARPENTAGTCELISVIAAPRTRANSPYRLLKAAMNSPVFDTPLIATNLERAYEAMRELRALALPCSHISELFDAIVLVCLPTWSSHSGRRCGHCVFFAQFVQHQFLIFCEMVATRVGPPYLRNLLVFLGSGLAFFLSCFGSHTPSQNANRTAFEWDLAITMFTRGVVGSLVNVLGVSGASNPFTLTAQCACFFLVEVPISCPRTKQLVSLGATVPPGLIDQTSSNLRSTHTSYNTHEKYFF